MHRGLRGRAAMTVIAGLSRGLATEHLSPIKIGGHIKAGGKEEKP